MILYGFSNAREETRAREQLLPREKVSGKARTRLGPLRGRPGGGVNGTQPSFSYQWFT